MKPDKLNKTLSFSPSAHERSIRKGHKKTKSFKKNLLNKEEELYAFKKYFIADLANQ